MPPPQCPERVLGLSLWLLIEDGCLLFINLYFNFINIKFNLFKILETGLFDVEPGKK